MARAWRAPASSSTQRPTGADMIGCTTENCTKPPGRSTRATSRSARSGSATSIRLMNAVTASKLAARNGSTRPIAEQVPDALVRDFHGRRDERLGDVDGDDAGTPAGQQPGVVALAAAKVQAGQPINRREQREESGGVDQVPVPVEPGT